MALANAHKISGVSYDDVPGCGPQEFQAVYDLLGQGVEVLLGRAEDQLADRGGALGQHFRMVDQLADGVLVDQALGVPVALHHPLDAILPVFV